MTEAPIHPPAVNAAAVAADRPEPTASWRRPRRVVPRFRSLCESIFSLVCDHFVSANNSGQAWLAAAISKQHRRALRVPGERRGKGGPGTQPAAAVKVRCHHKEEAAEPRNRRRNHES